MSRPEPLLIANESDAVAAALAERANALGRPLRRVAPEKLWEELGPRLEVGRDGSFSNSLASRAIVNRFGALAPGALDDWHPEDRHYVSMENGAALLAALLLHPRVINRPMPHDPTGCGLRSIEQFQAAARQGLRTPAWRVTSSLEEARRFLEERGGVAVYRRRTEEIFDFHRAELSRLPVDAARGRLLAPVFLLEGRVGTPVVTTYAAGRLWSVEALAQAPCAMPAEASAIAALFERSGLLFGQAVWIRGAVDGEHVFYGMTGVPQLRFYKPFADEVHDVILGWLEA